MRIVGWAGLVRGYFRCSGNLLGIFVYRSCQYELFTENGTTILIFTLLSLVDRELDGKSDAYMCT